jgi:hypothetical protein
MASAQLSRTPSSASNRKTWTWSGWVKRSSLGGNQVLFEGLDGSFPEKLQFTSDDLLEYDHDIAGTDYTVNTVAAFRDLSAWYHIVWAKDTTQATETDRIKLWVNGTQISLSESQLGYPGQNYEGAINKNVAHYIGANNGSEYFDGQMAHVNFVDGTALTPTSFGQSDANGVWIPKTSPSVTYGTNGYFMKFDNSANMGLDSGGGSNNYTTSGTILQTGDTPSNNSVVWDMNNRNSSTGVTNFARTATNSGNSWRTIQATMPMIGTTGKFYAEAKATSGTNFYFGVYDPRQARGDSQSQMDSNRVVYNYSGEVVKTLTGESTVTGLTAISAGNIIGIAVDKDNGVIKFYNNGSLIHTATNANITNKDLIFGTQMYGNMTVDWNFGHGFFGTTAPTSAVTANNGVWEYTPPTGHYALNTKSMKDNS